MESYSTPSDKYLNKAGRRLADEEWRYIQSASHGRWIFASVAILFLGVPAIACGMLFRMYYPDPRAYILAFIGATAVLLLVYIGRTVFAQAFAMEYDRERTTTRRTIEYVLKPGRSYLGIPYEARSETDEVGLPAHWSLFATRNEAFEAEVYERDDMAALALRLENGLAIDKEVPLGMLNLLTVRYGRGLTWYLFLLTAAIFFCLILNEVLGIAPVSGSAPESLGQLLSSPVIKYGWIPVTILGIPALYFWRQHKRALERIQAMYAEQGLPERGHERNVGSSAIGDASPLPSSTSGHDESGGDARVNERTS